MIIQVMIKYPHQLMLRLHLFEWLGCSFMFVNKRTILNENCVRVHVRWTKKSGNKVNSIGYSRFEKVATFSIDFESRDSNRTHQVAFRSCDSNFERKTMEIERTKYFDSQIERTLLRSKKSLAMS